MVTFLSLPSHHPSTFEPLSSHFPATIVSRLLGFSPCAQHQFHLEPVLRSSCHSLLHRNAAKLCRLLCPTLSWTLCDIPLVVTSYYGPYAIASHRGSMLRKRPAAPEASKRQTHDHHNSMITTSPASTNCAATLLHGRQRQHQAAQWRRRHIAILLSPVPSEVTSNSSAANVAIGHLGVDHRRCIRRSPLLAASLGCYK
jgi:hypothetical protein